MAKILRWPRHQWVSAGEKYEGLAGCRVCCGWEGEVPTECPGEPMTQEQKDAVCLGELDYFWREGWTTATRQERIRIRLYCEEGRDPWNC